jgi:hypothetical protein
MPHDLEKLDLYLGVPTGTSYRVIVQHQNPAELNPKLAPYGIALDSYGMVPKNQRAAWKVLMQTAGVDQRYWKDKDLLLPEAKITTLGEP